MLYSRLRRVLDTIFMPIIGTMIATAASAGQKFCAKHNYNYESLLCAW